ncbi:MAG: response regulator [Deltaproteobacteria bacterium]|nr:response regulator [Deltaproteobacteria bacterium]
MSGEFERRRSSRIQLLLRVRYRMAQELLDDTIENLGSGGIMLRTAWPFEIGARIAFTLSFPGLLEPIDMEGVVRWRRREPTPALGVEFVFRRDEERVHWQGIVDSITRARERPEKADRERCRVLLVEDNEFMREMFEHAIRRFHDENTETQWLHVESAVDGGDGLALAEKHHYDLAIIDHYLPGMSGSDLVRRIRAGAKNPQCPILMVSVGGDSVRREAMAAGADMFLHKPVLRKVLIETISTLTGARWQER